MEEKMNKILGKYPPNRSENLIPILQEIQEQVGYLDDNALDSVGKYLQIPGNKVIGVATFYDDFRFRPKGRYHFRICMGATCHLNGNTILLKELERHLNVKTGSTSRDQKFSLEAVSCLGACHLSPSVMVNGKVYSRIDLKKLPEFIESVTS
jgi:NADH-quinone oxidoreductase subunit E